MIGKITIGKSFRGCLLYCLNDKQKLHKDEVVFKNRAEVLMFNKCFGNQNELMQQFNEVRWLNMKLAKPVLHLTLSFAKDDKLDRNKLIAISEACAKDLGFENNQFVSIFHKDTEHPHMHIVANRIGFDKKTLSDSNNYQKTAAFCRKMELKHELKQVLSPRRYLSKEQRLLPRNDERKKALALAIRNAMSNSKDLDHFVRIMQSKGYKIIKSRGISFVDDKKVKIKGSEVGYSLQKIEQHLEFQHRLKTDKEFFKQVIERKPSRSLTDSVNNASIKTENIFNVHGLKQNLSETFDALLKPEQTHEQIEPKLLMKKKERKKKLRLTL
ncbi:MAG TPA: relaxase/mobilization nuclease domain-containing protein [Parafilimonas sp.]|nr:relaxase/mobilization nuclease domain-containing protein [Parafilimonas sp.]